MGKRRNKRGKAATPQAANYMPTQGGANTSNVTQVGAYTYAPARQCHKGPVAIFTVGKATVFAGSKFEVPWRRWKLLISCAGPELTPLPLITCSPSAKGLVPELADPTPWVALGWPDGGVPLFPQSTWLALADAIKNTDGDIGVCCVGGHGRTGTAVAILASLLGAVPGDEDPVVWLRKRYCREAVETQGQADYIAAMTGRSVSVEGSMDWWMDARYASTIVSTSPKPVSHNTADGVPATPAQAKLPLIDKPIGTPVLNRAGDIIGYDHTDEDDDEEGVTPWHKWG